MKARVIIIVLFVYSNFTQLVCAQPLLWENEPPLTEAAKFTTIVELVPASDPQGKSMWGVTAESTAINLCTKELKVTLWGPPERLTLSFSKTDVWDRRTADEKIYADGLTPMLNYYNGMEAYDFPCPKPVGQFIIMCDNFKNASQPAAITHLSTGERTVELVMLLLLFTSKGM